MRMERNNSSGRTPSLLRRILCSIFALSSAISLFACGERYSVQGGRLSHEIDVYLLRNGFCESKGDCRMKFSVALNGSVGAPCWRVMHKNMKSNFYQTSLMGEYERNGDDNSGV